MDSPTKPGATEGLSVAYNAEVEKNAEMRTALIEAQARIKELETQLSNADAGWANALEDCKAQFREDMRSADQLIVELKGERELERLSKQHFMNALAAAEQSERVATARIAELEQQVRTLLDANAISIGNTNLAIARIDSLTADLAAKESTIADLRAWIDRAAAEAGRQVGELSADLAAANERERSLDAMLKNALARVTELEAENLRQHNRIANLEKESNQ